MLIVVIDYTEWGDLIFGTLPIAPGAWLFILPFGLSMLLLEEIRKFIVGKFKS